MIKSLQECKFLMELTRHLKEKALRGKAPNFKLVAVSQKVTYSSAIFNCRTSVKSCKCPPTSVSAGALSFWRGLPPGQSPCFLVKQGLLSWLGARGLWWKECFLKVERAAGFYTISFFLLLSSSRVLFLSRDKNILQKGKCSTCYFEGNSTG